MSRVNIHLLNASYLFSISGLSGIDIHIKFYICLQVSFYVVFEKDKCLSRFHICFVSMSVHQVRKLAIMIQNYCWEGSLLANFFENATQKAGEKYCVNAAGIVATTGELAAVQISFGKAWLRQRPPLGGGWR